MKLSRYAARLLIVFIAIPLAASAFAWDSRWHFKPANPRGHPGYGSRPIEMQKKPDHDSLNRFKGTIDSSNGYTIMRNLNGGVMRGFIDKDGSGLLRDQDGTYHHVNTRW